MTAATLAAVRISLDTGCGGDTDCAGFAGVLLDQLGSGRYDQCSVLEIPASLDEWLAGHRTARKRAARCARRGYTAAVINRHQHREDVHWINTSLPSRQGRPMAAGYLSPPVFPDVDYPCDLHGVHTYGVLSGGRLVAYLWMYRAGELALVSSILGHGELLRDEIMYLLIAGAIERELEHGPGYMVYNRHDSGTDGLRFFKERCGFEPTEVAWAP